MLSIVVSSASRATAQNAIKSMVPTSPHHYVMPATRKTYIPKVRGRAHDPFIVYYADAYADHYHVPRALVHAIITMESGWTPGVISNVGALGLMQLLPETAHHYGVIQPFSVSDNLGGGVHYLADLLWEFHGDMRLAVAGYYAGTKYVGRKGLNYSNPAVTAYVRKVRILYIRELEMHDSQAQREGSNERHFYP